MKKLVLSAVALAAMASVAWADSPASQSKAGPVALTDSQLDSVTAAGYVYRKPLYGKRGHGGFKYNKSKIEQTAISYNTNHSAAIGLCKVCAVTSNVWQHSNATNTAVVNQNSPGF